MRGKTTGKCQPPRTFGATACISVIRDLRGTLTEDSWRASLTGPSGRATCLAMD